MLGKPRLIVLGMLIVAVFFAFKNIAQAAGTGNIPSSPPEDVKQDLSNVEIRNPGLNADVRGWPISTEIKLDSVTFPDPNDVGGELCLNHTMPWTWPDEPGFEDVPASAWVFVYRDGKWHGTTFEYYYREGREAECRAASSVWDNAQVFNPTFIPQRGERYGFMISGLARGGHRNIEERTNVVMATWEKPTCQTNCFSGDDPPPVDDNFCPAPKYKGVLEDVMNEVLSENPDVANLPNIESDGRQNARTFISLVESKLISQGYQATDEVLNGNNNPNTGDLIAVWGSGDTAMERYDVIRGESSPPKTIQESITADLVGTIPLNCTASGGGNDCSDKCDGGGSSGGSDPSAGTIPGITGSEANALPGLRGDLAYSTVSSQWLLVSEYNGIIGQMMNENNKPVGSLINISTNGLAPKVAFGKSKFLVVWKNSDGTTVNGQFISPTGTLMGGNFKIVDASADFERGRNSTMKFDTKNNRFVFTFGQFNNTARIVTVTENGDVQDFTVSTDGGASILTPDIAINPDLNEYCLGYQWYNEPSNRITVRPISLTGTAGQESDIDIANNTNFRGIGYSPYRKTYFVLYDDISGNNSQLKILNQCGASADDLDTDPVIIAEDNGNWAMLSYNPTSDTYGIATQSSGEGNNFYVLDSSGNTISGGAYNLFLGGSGNFWPIIQPNTSTGTFAAISSQDRTQIKFVSTLGSLGIASLPQPFRAGQFLTADDEGLPTDLGKFIESIFTWSLRLIGLIIFLRFFWAGILWFTAAGNSANINRSKEIMKNAALGAVVLFSAYVILYSLNPDFVGGSLDLPGIENTSPTTNTNTTTN